MTFDSNKVSDALALVQHNNGGKAFVSAVHNDSVRLALIQLLGAYGVYGLGQKVTADELATLYASARKKHSIGAACAERIKNRYRPNPLLMPEPAPDAPKVPSPPIEAPKAPNPLDGLLGDNGDKAPSPGETRAELHSLMALLLKRYATTEFVDTSVSELRDSIADTLLQVTDAVPTTVIGTIRDKLPALVAAEMVKHRPTQVEIVAPEMPPVQLGLAHFRTPQIIKALAAGVNVYLHGPAGSGKTTAAQQAAEAFKLPFYFAAKVESEYMLLGFKDARGETVRTQFREAYEHGGVFLFDELDGSSPGAVVALNAALANGVCPFPDGVIQRHANFKCIGAGNTKLSGANRQYVGRQQLDAASVDRFAFIEFPYDEQLETAIAPNKGWCEYVQAVRAAIRERQLPHLVTPRASYDGAKLLASGFTPQEVADMSVFKGLDDATVRQITDKVGNPTKYLIEPEKAPDAPAAFDGLI